MDISSIRQPTTPPVEFGIYARLSHHRRSHSRHTQGFETSASVERQLAECNSYAVARGWPVSDAAVYVDDDVSAYRRGARREAFERMLGDLDSRTIAGVVVWKLDRLVRSHRDFERFWELREERRATFATVVEPVDTTTELGVATIRLLVSFAFLESYSISVRVRSALQQAAQEGRRHGGGSRPFGYTADRSSLVPEEALHIREAADRLLHKGWSLTRIAKDWNAQGITTSQGGYWHTVQVRELLKAERIAGLRVHHGQTFKAVWPAIVDLESHQRLKIAIEDRRTANRTPSSYLLRDKLVCGRCGKKMTGAHRAEGAEYRCPPSPSRCGRLSINAKHLDALIADEVVFRVSNHRPRVHGDDEQDRLLGQLQDDEERVAQLGRDYADHLVDREAFLGARERLEARIAACSRRLSTVFVVLPIGDSGTIRKRWDEHEADLAWRRRLLDVLVERIIVRPATKNRFEPERVEVVWKLEPQAPRLP